MKSRVTRILSIGIALAAAAAVQAQTSLVTANVPFNFYMGSSAMAQGSYWVGECSHGPVVCMKSADGAKAALSHSIEAKTPNDAAKLVFRRYGDTYFLAEIWTGGSATGLALSPSAREREIARNGAAPTLAVIRLALRP